MNVQFNPEYVKEYRLIGFDNKVGALKDSLSAIEGGEIGSGYSMVAMFEITPTELNKGAIKDHFTSGKFAEISLQYRLPNEPRQMQFNHISKFDFIPFHELDKTYQFAAVVTMFGALLRSSPYTRNIGWNDIVSLADETCSKTDLLQKEFITLVQQARNLYTKVKKKKGGMEEQ
jgi:Ca-activated chloride channel family protein